MKKLLCAPLLALTLIPLLAQLAKTPEGIVVWKAASLKAYAGKLGPQGQPAEDRHRNPGQPEREQCADGAPRGPGEAEFHENAADFMVVVGGEANLVLGGTIRDGKTTGPGEIRGAIIDSGKTYAVEAGDIVNIPAKTPHQVLVAPGKQITYFLLKVGAK